jgi:hypothetical protein
MSGNAETVVDAAQPYLPDQIAIITVHELRTLEEAIPAEVTQLDEVDSRLRAASQDVDIH